jgi:hypothetical protein
VDVGDFYYLESSFKQVILVLCYNLASIMDQIVKF